MGSNDPVSIVCLEHCKLMMSLSNKTKNTSLHKTTKTNKNRLFVVIRSKALYKK